MAKRKNDEGKTTWGQRIRRGTYAILGSFVFCCGAVLLIPTEEDGVSPTLIPTVEAQAAANESTMAATATDEPERATDVVAALDRDVDTATTTVTSTSTLTMTPTATVTLTSTVTATATITNTPPPTRTPRSFINGYEVNLYFFDPKYYVVSSANVRLCPTTEAQCRVIGSLPVGAEFQALGDVTGEDVLGSDLWYYLTAFDENVFVHSSLVSEDPPATAAPTRRPQPTFPPQQVVSTQPPVQSGPSYACNCSKTCGSMTCDEAYFQLNQCGCSQRDGDGDGVPCESQCG